MHWDGVGTGEGYLRRRQMTVTATGRRSSVRPRHHRLWLPSATGAVADVDAGAGAGADGGVIPTADPVVTG